MHTEGNTRFARVVDPTHARRRRISSVKTPSSAIEFECINPKMLLNVLCGDSLDLMSWKKDGSGGLPQQGVVAIDVLIGPRTRRRIRQNTRQSIICEVKKSVNILIAGKSSFI